MHMRSFNENLSNSNSIRLQIDIVKLSLSFQQRQLLNTVPWYVENIQCIAFGNNCNENVLLIAECNKTLLHPLPSLYSQPVTCRISSSCATVQCCVDVPEISSSFNTKLEIDPCTFQMVVSIDQLRFSKFLFEYDWGQEEEVWLFGVVRMT